MIDYASLYRELLVADAEAERALLPGAERPAEAEFHDLWQRRHGISPLGFQEILNQIQDARRVEDVVRACGSVHLGLSVLSALVERGVAAIGERGELAWKEPLFPAPPAPDTEMLERLEARLSRDAPEVRYGQLRASARSSAARVAWLVRDLPPIGRSVLFLGDDDLTSVLLAASISGDVTVLDADPRVLTLVAETAAEEGLSIKTVQHDLRRPLPEGLRRRFDSVCCDPVDDGAWLQLWLQRAFDALMPIAGARLFLSIGERRLGDRLAGLHRFALEHGLLLEHRAPGLNEYRLSQARDAFAHTFRARVAEEPWAGGVEWAAHSDLLVFRYHGEAKQMWPQAYRELRRGI